MQPPRRVTGEDDPNAPSSSRQQQGASYPNPTPPFNALSAQPYSMPPTSPVNSFPLPFPPQSKISDLDSMFNRRAELGGSLPIMPGDFDAGAYGFAAAPQQYPNSSTPVSSPPDAVLKGMQGSLPGSSTNAFPNSTYNYTNPALLSSSYPSNQPNMLQNPWPLNSSLSHPGNPITTTSPQNARAYPPYPITTNAMYHPFGALDNPPSASSASVELDSWESVSPDDEQAELRLTAEDMADDEELAELRAIEQGGPSRRAERRRMRNKLAQRAFRARAKVSRKDVASRLVEAEASASTHNRELDMLRTMVHSLQNENRELRRQIKESKDRPGPVQEGYVNTEPSAKLGPGGSGTRGGM